MLCLLQHCREMEMKFGCSKKKAGEKLSGNVKIVEKVTRRIGSVGWSSGGWSWLMQPLILRWRTAIENIVIKNVGRMGLEEWWGRGGGWMTIVSEFCFCFWSVFIGTFRNHKNGRVISITFPLFVRTTLYRLSFPAHIFLDSKWPW